MKKSYKESKKTYDRLVWENRAVEFAKKYFGVWKNIRAVKLELNNIEYAASNFNEEIRIYYIWNKKKYVINNGCTIHIHKGF